MRYQKTLQEDSGIGRPPRVRCGSKPVSFGLDMFSHQRLGILARRWGVSMRDVVEDLLHRASITLTRERLRSADIEVEATKDGNVITVKIHLADTTS